MSQASINIIPSSKDIVQFYYSLPDPILRAKFFRDFSTRSNTCIETMNQHFRQLNFPKDIRAIASSVISETKLQLAGEAQKV